MNFLNSPLQNRIGKKIISKLDETGKSYISDIYPDLKLKL